MKLVTFPPRTIWDSLLRRPTMNFSELEPLVQKIIDKVREKGDEALLEYARSLDKTEINNLIVTDAEIDEANKQVDNELKSAINLARNNIEAFHAKQLPSIETIETMPGVECWRKAVPITRVGLYIPGGTAPLFSTVLMLGVPAAIAGCKEIVLCTPPARDGKIHPAILYTANLVGITKIIKAGGAQAIAAMTYGTESVPAVYKIFGPGNQYVTCAKQLVQKTGIAIDMPAGPSEVAVIADETANAGFIAADLLSQAEHGVDSQVLLVSNNVELIQQVNLCIEKQLETLPRKEFAAKALDNSRFILVNNLEEGMELINEYAPEHLIIMSRDASRLAEQVMNAGSVFIGSWSPESAGDYASGTNHTLPTNGYARAYSGVSVDSFLKKITFQQLSPVGIQNIGPAIERMAAAEGLEAHKLAVSIRLAQIK